MMTTTSRQSRRNQLNTSDGEPSAPGSAANSTPSGALTIRFSAGTGELSAAQKTFNRLINQLEKQRVHLLAWEVAIPAYRQKYVRLWLPLYESLRELHVEMVHRLDRASLENGLNKRERGLIGELLTELAGELMSDYDDPELKAIYNRHSPTDYDTDAAEKISGIKSMLEEVLGRDFGDDVDMNSPDAMLERAREYVNEDQAFFEAREQAREAHRNNRKKSTKHAAREAARETESQQISQSIREVYRKLASALHPDREPDPVERERKNGLMQRTNLAYEKKNLLQLLELQLELEHIDQDSINSLGEDRLKHYNHVLKEQLAELNQEILRIELEFRDQFGLSPWVRLIPGKLDDRLSKDIAGIKTAVSDLKNDLRKIGNLTTLKEWLKQVRRQAWSI